MAVMLKLAVPAWNPHHHCATFYDQQTSRYVPKEQNDAKHARNLHNPNALDKAE
jgi:hypothetical protein